MNEGAPLPASIITFYSYKGGVGRTMTLANVAWTLASNGRRVLIVDWDLEAPGLHRYFAPFLDQRRWESCPGILDLLIDHVDSRPRPRAPDYLPRLASEGQPEAAPRINSYAVPLEWTFPEGGGLDLMPAGRPNAAYAARLAAFSWESFYSTYSGSNFLEGLKKTFRHLYDYVLIDSRSGVGDVAGICTLQMPDKVVAFFTPNRQSIEGTARVLETVHSRVGPPGEPRIRVFPVPTRVESSEKERLDAARERMRQHFSRFLDHLPSETHDQYWGSVEIPSIPFYSYEEILCAFGDRAESSFSMLSVVDRICAYLTDGMIVRTPPISESRRLAVLSGFLRHANISIDSPRCFISYSSKDTVFAERLRVDLQERGVACWFAPHDLPIGAKIRSGIENALQTHEKIILILSKNSIASTWVETEVEATLEREVKTGTVLLMPIRLDASIMSTTQAWAASIRRQRNIGDFSNWTDSEVYEASLSKLVDSLDT